jgi:hypothetical protein
MVARDPSQQMLSRRDIHAAQQWELHIINMEVIRAFYYSIVGMTKSSHATPIEAFQDIQKTITQRSCFMSWCTQRDAANRLNRNPGWSCLARENVRSEKR